MTIPRVGTTRVDDVPAAFADLLLELAPASIALSGGGTAAACYEAVAARGADWSHTTFWFGDERWVPVGTDDSNEGLARRLWLDHTAVGGIESMRGAGDDPDSAAAAYDAALRAAAPLAVVHLGLGPDGHTMSIFPGSPTCVRVPTDPVGERTMVEGSAAGAGGGPPERERWVVTAGDESHPHRRLTLTFAALAAVGRIVVTVAGAAKHAAFAAVQTGDHPDLPATRLVTDPVLAAKTLWLVDEPAATGRG